MDITAATACECKEDGHCPRYNREMRGFLRRICQGDGIDLVLATQYRQLWLDQKTLEHGLPGKNPTECPHRGEELRDEGGPRTRSCEGCGGRVRLKLFACGHKSREPEEVTLADCRQCVYRPVDREGTRWLILRNRLCPGDVLVMTAAVYSLHKQHPGKYAVAVDTSCQALWEHNPDVVALEEAHAHGAEVIEMEYPLIHQSGARAVHFMQGYCDFLETVLGVRVPLLTNRPHVYLSRREKSWINQVEELTGSKEPFWIINAGRKDDYTAKFWGTAGYQRVVDTLADRVRFVQVGESGHYHPRLRGVVDLVGKTDSRQLVRLVWNCQGVLGGVSFLQHLAAALEKPSVCIMGGREGVQWNSYNRQALLHTVGALDCCREGGCWKSRVVPLGDGDEKDKSLCKSPQGSGAEAIPLCMARITPEEVAGAILKYLPVVS